MTVQADPTGQPATAGRDWYSRSPDEVTAALGVDPAEQLVAADAALECRSETGTVLTTASFDSKQMNRAMLAEFVLAVLVTQADVVRRLLGTAQLNLRQFAWALLPAIALLALWELGKLLARRSQAGWPLATD
jgi:hypothetical protein